MAKKPQAYRRIGEVADWLGVPTSTIRYWTMRFKKQVRPVQRAGGRRYYRVEDMVLLGGIKTILHDHGLSIDDLKAEMKIYGVDKVAAFSPMLPEGIEQPETIEIAEIAEFVKPPVEETAEGSKDETPDAGSIEEETRVTRVAGGRSISVGTPGPAEIEAVDDAPAEESGDQDEVEPDAAEETVEAAMVEDSVAEPEQTSADALSAPLPAADGSDAAPKRRRRARRRANPDLAELMRELESLRERMGR